MSGPSAWKAEDFAGDSSWIRTFSRQELDELHAATAKLQATGMGPEEFRREDFPLPTLSTYFHRRVRRQITEKLAASRAIGR